MECVSLATHPELRASVIKLMEANFPQGETQAAPPAFDIEFATLLTDNAPERVLFILDSGLPVAALAWHPVELKSGLKLAAIGLVVTAESHRKQGHSRSLLRAAEEAAEANGAALACLWSDLLDFYTKMGYVLTGSEVSWDLEEDLLTEDDEHPAAKPQLRAATSADIPTLHALYKKDPVGPRREPRQFERQLSHSDSLALVACDSSGTPLAYALAGKGRDLRNVVHELIGDASMFPALIAGVRAQLRGTSFTESLNGPSPRLQFPFSHPQSTELESLFAEGEQGAVCFAKVLKIEPLIEALNLELSAQKFRGLRLHYNAEINAWTLNDATQDIFMSPDPGHLLQIFCSPWGLEDLEGLPGRTAKRLQGWLPYPLYFWGMDSV